MGTIPRHRVKTVLDPNDGICSSEFRVYRIRPGYPTVLFGEPHIHSSTGPSSSLVMDDVVTEEYKKRVASGAIVNSPMVSVASSTNPLRPVSFSLRGTNYTTLGEDGYIGSGTIIPFKENASYPPGFLATSILGPTTSLKNNVVNLAVTRAYASIDESSILALATAAESKKTIAWGVSNLKRVLTIVRKLRKLELKAAYKELQLKKVKSKATKRKLKAALDATANAHMELRYALRPLMYDCVGIMDALYVPRSYLRNTYRGKASGRLTHQDLVTGPLFYPASTVDIGRSVVYEVSARAGVLCSVDVNAVQAWGLDAIVSSTWELIPGSFIVDWFVNFGDFLAAHTPNMGIKQLASWVSVRETTTQTNKSVGSARFLENWGYKAECQVAPFSWDSSICRYERIPDPQLSIWPQFNVNLNALKLIDLGIITKQIAETALRPRK